MDGKSNMETYIIICKIHKPMGICCMAQETQTGPLYQPRGVGWGGRWAGNSKGRGYMYTYGWFMLSFDKKQQNYVKQLSFNKRNKLHKAKKKKKIRQGGQFLSPGYYWGCIQFGGCRGLFSQPCPEIGVHLRLPNAWVSTTCPCPSRFWTGLFLFF